MGIHLCCHGNQFVLPWVNLCHSEYAVLFQPSLLIDNDMNEIQYKDVIKYGSNMFVISLSPSVPFLALLEAKFYK